MKIREIVESATAGASIAANVAIGAVYKNKPGKTAKQGGRKGQLAHWLANMKAGRAKKNK